MAKVILENLDERDYTGYYRVKSPGSSTPAVKRVIVHASDITEMDEEIFDHVVAVNKGQNTIADKIAQGRINKLGSGGEQLSDDNSRAARVRQNNYANMCFIYKQLNNEGGKSNTEIAPHVDDDGIPSFEVIRKNCGDTINGEDYDKFANRLRKEVKAGLHQKGLLLPGMEGSKDVADKIDERTVAKDEDKGKGDETDEDKGKGDVVTGEDVEGYPAKLKVLEDNLEQIVADGGLARNGAPKLGALKEVGLDLSKDQRDHLWGLYLEKHPADNSDEE